MKPGVEGIPSRGDMEAAFRRLLDDGRDTLSSRLADALIVRDWLKHALLVMGCCFKSQTTCGPHVRCEELLARLLDDRVTTGR